MKSAPGGLPFDPTFRLAPLYKGLEVDSLYLPVPDGARLAIEVLLPAGRPVGTRLPTILFQTRYWRAIELKIPFKYFFRKGSNPHPITGKMNSFFSSRGFALVCMDVRGTGASFGNSHYPWEPVTLEDACQVLDWITDQPWSNGCVAGMGVSYLGRTAEMLLATGHPAVKAVVPMFSHTDPYLDIAYPGGVFNQRFIEAWDSMNRELDDNQVPEAAGSLSRLAARGVLPVRGSAGRPELEAAVQEHQRNHYAFQVARFIKFRDEQHPMVDVVVDDLGIQAYHEPILHSPGVSYGWGSWLDGGTANTVLQRFAAYPGAVRACIGAWNHGGTIQADPFFPRRSRPHPSLEEQWDEIAAFLSQYMQPGEIASEAEKTLYYYVLGAGIWQKSSIWPPAGVTSQRWFLRSQGKLGLQAEQGRTAPAVYRVDFEATSGLENRWWELNATRNETVKYPDRAAADRRLLCFTTPPLDSDVDILGYPLLRLYVKANLPDLAFIAYLEDVSPNGRVTYITEGELRALHRQVSSAANANHTPVPYHTYRQADAQPLVPGETAEIIFALQPTAVRIFKGHAVRLAIAGHDRDTFLRIPEEGFPEYELSLTGDQASSIDLPVRPVASPA